MNDCSSEGGDQPVYATYLEVFHDKLIGKKWKKLIGLVFEESTYGRARLELFVNEEKVKDGAPTKTILLTDCISMRGSHTGHRQTIRIQLKDNSTLEIASQSHDALLEALSRIAFPKKYVTLTSAPLLDSPTSEEEFVLSDTYPVLLLPSPLTKAKQLSEGSYTLNFGNSLVLSTADTQVMNFQYCDFVWIAAGENCLGFEIENGGIYEFICAQPLVVVESFRCHLRFSSVFTPVSVKTSNKYNRTYHPSRTIIPPSLDTPETSKNSTLESKQSTSSSVSSHRDISFDFAPQCTSSPMNTSYTSPQSTNSPLNSSFTSDYEVCGPVDEKREKIGFGIFGFFRRNSKKRKDDEGRTSFEQNADSEWLRIEKKVPPPPPPRKYLTEDIHTLQFREELERSLAASKMRRDQARETAIPEE